MSEIVASVYCNNEWASPPRFWIGDPERYRPLVEEALMAFSASSMDAATFLQAGDYGYLADPGESGEWLIHSRVDEAGQWHGYKENLDPWQLDRVEVYRPKNGRISVSLIWAYKYNSDKYNSDKCWVDLYLDVPASCAGCGMSDLICRKTMTRCQTPGMCAPHGGCSTSAEAARAALAERAVAPTPAEGMPEATTSDRFDLGDGSGALVVYADDYDTLAQRCRDLELNHAMLRDELESEQQSVAAFRKERDALRAEVEALRKDAERYRWLRNHGATCRWEEGDTEVCNHPGLLDEAVDESIARAKGGEE